MQVIPKKWYTVYNWVLVAISAVFLISYIVSKFINLGTINGLVDNGIIGATFAGLTILLGAVGYNLVSKKYGSWLGAIITNMTFDLFVITHFATIGHDYLMVFVVLWWLLAAYSGAFGIVVVLTSNFLTVIICVFKSSLTLSGLTMDYKVLLVGTVIASVVPYLVFWNPKTNKIKSVDSGSLNLGQLPTDTKGEDEALTESMGDGVFVADNTGKITLFNSAASKMTDWPKADAVGVDVNLVLKITTEEDKPIPPENNPFTAVIKSQTKLETNGILTGRGGNKIYAALVISPIITHGTMNGIVGLFKDVSAQRALEKQRADFISTASHEMRTPVAAIEGYLSLSMNPQVASIDTKARDYLDKAYESTQRLGKLFQDLLTSSKAEDGRLVNNPTVVEMGEFIDRLAESFQLAAMKKHLMVDYMLIGDENTSESVNQMGKVIKPLYYTNVDKDRLSEVLTNIFDNAVKYTQAGKITIGLGGDNTNVQVFIRDTGVGIPAEDIPHLFQKFYRVDSSEIRTIGGTGLGLYICKKIIDLYGGQIWVESEINKGSTFRINLPRLTAERADQLLREESEAKQIAMPSSNATA